MNEGKKVSSETLELEIFRHEKSLPLVGWHSPTGSFQHLGQEWKIMVIGGVQRIAIAQPGKKGEYVWFSASVGAIASAMVGAILAKGGKNGTAEKVDKDGAGKSSRGSSRGAKKTAAKRKAR